MNRFDRLYPLIRKAIPVLILVIGATLSALAFWEARRVDDQRVVAALDVRAQFRANTIQERLQDATVPVQSLATFVSAQKVLDTDEFRGFAAASRGTDPIFHLTWAPRVTGEGRPEYEAKVRREEAIPDYTILERDDSGRFVPAKERDEYYPVQFEERFEDPVTLLGFDHFSGPNRRAAAEHARDVGEPTATVVVRLLPGEKAGDRIVLFWPVYRGGRVPDSVEERRATIDGFATGAFRLDDAVEFAVHGLPPVAARLSIFYGQMPDRLSSAPAVQNDLSTGKTQPGTAALGEPDPNGLRLTKSFFQFGQPWTLVFDFTPQVVAAARSPERWEYPLLGLILTLMLAAYVAAQQRRQSVVEALVAERTQELNQISDQMTAIIESSPLATIVNDRETRVTFWNRAAAQFFGYDANEVIGVQHPLVPAGEEAAFYALIERMEKGEILRGVEVVRRRKDGSKVEAAVSAAAFRNSAGSTQGFVYTVEDITERKQREAIEREIAERLQAVVDTAVDGIVMIDAQGSALLFNPAAERLFGYRANEVIGNNINMLMPLPFANEHDGYIGRYRGTGERKVIGLVREVVGRRKDGTTFPMHIAVGEAKQYGRPIFVGVVHDLTAQRKADEALHRIQTVLSGIIESSDDAIISKTLEGVVTSWNKAAERIFGFSADEMIGHHIWAIAAPGREDDLTAILEKIRQGQRVEHYETQRRRKDGAIIDISLTVSPLLDAQGTIIGASKIARDITEKKAAEESLKRSQEHLARVQSVARIGSTEFDLNTHETTWSDEVYLLLGIDKSLFKPDVELFAKAVHPDDRDFVRSVGLKERTGHEMEPIEFRVVGSDGSIRWLYQKAAFVRDETGRPTRLLATMYDITERKKAEEALRESERRFAVMFHDSPVAIWISDLSNSGRIIDANSSWLDTFGLERDEVIGRTGDELNLWPDARTRDAMYAATMKSDSVWSGEVVLRRKDGTLMDTAITIRHTQIDGRPRAIGVGIDITERKRAEAAQKESEELLSEATRAAAIGVFVHDHASNIVSWSPELRQLYDVDADEPITYDLFVLRVHPDDRAETFAAVEHSHDPKGDGRFDMEHRTVRRDGKIRWLVSRGYTRFEGDGSNRHPVRTLGAVSDVSAHRETEARRQQLERQLQQSQKMEAIGQLTGGVAHDFNNLLMVMLGNLELIEEQIGGDHKVSPWIADALSAGKSGSDLTYRLLAFSRRQTLEPEATDINKRIAGFVPLIRRTIGEAIEIRQKLADSVWPVMIDPSQFDSAILNLAVNARDAMPSGGWIEIATENVSVDEAYAAQIVDLKSGDFVRVAVSDSGSGMPPDVVARAFDPFFTTKEVGKGTGLGLSMVYGFIKQSGGNATIYSEVGKGTVIRLLLPRATHAAGPSVVAVGPQDAARSSGVTILVVEDDAKVRAVTVAFLKSLGYRPLDAATGHEAITILAAHPEVVLLLSDVILAGGETGPEVAETAKQLRPDLKIMFASGYTEDALERNGHLDPDVILLHKPFTKSALSTKVREALDRDPR